MKGKLMHRRIVFPVLFILISLLFATAAFADDPNVAVIRDNSVHWSGNLGIYLGAVITSTIAIIGAGYHVNRDRKAERKEFAAEIAASIKLVKDDHDCRFDELETKVDTFLTGSQIEKLILHETTNRKEANAITLRKFEAHDEALVALRTNVSRIEQHQVDQTEGIRRIQDDLKSLAIRMEAGLARMTELLLSMSK